MSLDKKQLYLKVITAGDSSVGKTSLQYRFHSNRFQQLKTTCGMGLDFYCYKTEKFDVMLNVQLWDTAGQERFNSSFGSSWYRTSHGVTLVYDITNRNSFERLQYWLDNMHQITPTPNPIKIIVGNKCDLQENRQVPYSEGLEFAVLNGCKFYETSAKTAINVKEMYNELINDIVEVI